MMRFCRIISNLLLTFVIASCADAKVRHYVIETVAEYPHDTESYTQGLFFVDGQMYESTGLHGKSSFRKIDIETGKAIEKLDFDKKYFVEGSSVLGGELFILTWESRVAFIYDAATMEYKSTWKYPREGWGLTTDGKQLIASDGSATLYFMDSRFNVQRKVQVTFEGRPVGLLNELEWIDGKIWANVYTSNEIVIIDPKDGKVSGIIDCRGLLPRALRRPSTDVLNGIAIDDATGKIYLTGKNWPRLYEIRLVEKK
ncbi:MAG: glutaminyl-peptide cyclotransferase [Bacteroidales bacterium]|nr:glutaminyl-peptide cyclotransferase [Bacteroidales bacterium]